MRVDISDLKIEKRAFINGEYVSSVSGNVIKKCNAYSEYDLSGIAACDEKDVEIAVKAARKAYESGIWRNKSTKEKKNILLKLANLMEEHREELAMLDCLETCRAYQNYFEDSLPKAIETIRYSAECIDKYYDNNLVSIIIGIILVLLFIFLYYRKDCIIGVKSIGKRILKLNIYCHGKIVTDKNFLKNRVRCSFWLFPAYPFHILIDNKSLGDIKFDTEVR